MKFALRELANRVAELDAQIARVAARRRRLLAQTAPALIAINGVGPDTAAALLLAAGDNPAVSAPRPLPQRCSAPAPSQPRPARPRMRLKRGGDRLGNAALWRIVITRIATQREIRAYVPQRTKEGPSKPEIIRCLKRFVAGEVFNAYPANS